MTIDEIKEKLPDVKVNINGTILIGQLTGRKMPHAIVFLGRRPFEFSWQAVRRSINNDIPLKV